MRGLRDRYADDPSVRAAREALAADRELTIGACHGGLVPTLLAALAVAAPTGWPRLVVAGDPNGLRDDLEELGVVAAVLPEIDRFDAVEDDQSDIDRTAQNRRVAAIEAYAAGALLIGTPRAVQQPVPDLREVASSSVILKPGEEHDIQGLVESLVDAGYKVTGTVEGRGELAVRGGIVDVFPFIGNDALRIEFFGDQVEAIRRFDPFTQESIARAEEAVLATASGSLATLTLWQQLPPGPVLVIGDLALRARLEQPHGRREVRLARQLEEGALDGASLGVDRFKGDLRRGLAELKAAIAETGKTEQALVLLARNEEAKRELQGHCSDHQVVAEIRIGRLSAGWRDLEQGLLVVHDYELAQRQPAKRRVGAKVAGGSPLSSLTDLKRNDLVVHLRHGIGIFRGMATLEKRGFLEDYLVLEFAEESKLYVPVDGIDLVQKYVGASGARPDLAKIGGAAWAKKRARAEKAIEDLSGELLESHARRVAAGGIAYPADGPEIRRFEAAFPFEETEDQLAAVREIKADMESPIAMDRLLCGDVGFGKTEVAMRAAFKAVAGDRQVAVLAPTTLLAEQHVETFTERFAGFGYEIAGLTRFNGPGERKAVLEKTARGEVDILIGTHALLTEQLRFAELGLLIIDEEHRFGVKHKEKLRALRGHAELPAGVVLPAPDPAAFSLARTGDEPLAALLVEQGVLTAEQAEAARASATRKGLPLDEILIADGIATAEELVAAIALHAWVPRVDLAKYAIKPRALATLTGDEALRYGALPLDLDHKRLVLAMVNPLDDASVAALEAKGGLPIQRVVTTRAQIDAAIEKHYPEALAVTPVRRRLGGRPAGPMSGGVHPPDDVSQEAPRADSERQTGPVRSTVPPDVLTLSATPIPRTLHFSLLGLRDISVLAEAPAERLAVETRVAPWDDQLIKTAIARELERNGQVFFVHNKVQDIDSIVFKLSRLVPELKLDVVHGQMPEDRIARVMDAYKQGQTQCLVTTSIIESGIDIPNANTLFVNNAHFFGLAELHQIRGRIGRFHHQAYAYFLVPGNKELTQEARDRLDAIQEYAHLGAGFKLAMRDLELRGAGNLLGGEQSGHIDAIGYELYTKLLGEAVARMKEKVAATQGAAAAAKVKGPATAKLPGGRTADELKQTLGLNVDAFIPDTYLETPALKFEIHKHLDACRRISDVAALAQSTRDRFGALVDPVARLFIVRALRLRCAELGVVRIEVADRQLRLHLSGPLPPELAKASLPELVHLQLDGSVLVLFLKPKLEQDVALRILARLVGLDLGFLGRGF